MVKDGRISSGINLDSGLWGPAVDTGLEARKKLRAYLQCGAFTHHKYNDISWGTLWMALAEAQLKS